MIELICFLPLILTILIFLIFSKLNLFEELLYLFFIVLLSIFIFVICILFHILSIYF